MDLDIWFVSAAILAGRDAVRAAMNKGIDESYLSGDGLKVWKFTLDHLKTYSDVPDLAIIESKVGVKLAPPPPAPEGYFDDELIQQRLHMEIGKQLFEVEKWHSSSDASAAYKAYEDGLQEIRKLGIATARTVSLPSLGPDFLDYYDKLKAGHLGILTPWPTVNEATLGFWPEDFILYVARMGVGKTWALIIIANHVWAIQKKRVLFVTTEMGREKIYQRWIAVNKKYPYNELRKAQLNAFSEQKMRDWVAKIQQEEGLYIIGGDFDFRIESLEGAIEESEPDVVFVDGAYLLEVKGNSRIERAANSYDALKRTAKRSRIPLVASTQFNREVKGNKLSTVGPEKIAMSDAAGWNADLIYGLVRTDDMIKDKRMIQLPLKFREGEGEQVETHWDFDTMNFDELPKGAAAAAVGGGGVGGAGGPAGGVGGSGGQGGGSAPNPDPYDTGLLFGGDKDPVPF